METITHLSWFRRVRIAWTALVVAALMVPSGLDSAPAAAAGTAPGPIPSVSLVSRGVNSVTMSWTVPWTAGGSEITDYGIEIRPAGGEWARVTDGVSTETTAVVNGIQSDTDFNVRVFAVNGNGNGPATVYGAMSSLLSNNEELCGGANGQPLSCFTYAKAVKTVTYYDYPTPSAATRHIASDIIDLEGSCALSRSVGVICTSQWQNRHGELGQGLTGGPVANFRVPIPTDSSIIAITSDSMRNCALDSSRRLWCWGLSRDDLGNKSLLLDPVVVKTGVLQYEGSCARLWDDTVECLNANYKWTSIPGMTPITKLATSHGDGWSNCGITAERKVLCFNTVDKTWSERTDWQGAVDIVRGAVSPTCVLLETGVVKCYAGTNYRGELGDGGNGLGGYVTVKMPEPAIAISTNKRVWVTGHLTYTCAVGVSSTVYCWGEYPRNFSTGLAISTIPLSVTGGGPNAVRSLSAPATVVGLTQSARAATSVTMSWNPASSPDAPVLAHTVRWSRDGGSSWAHQSIGPERTWTSGTVEPNSQLVVQVAAVNQVGTGPWSATVSASTTTPPARPTSVREISHTATSATIEWAPSADEDEPITGYRIERSYNGVDWISETVGRESWRTTLVNLVGRSAIQVRVKAINAAGESAYSDQVVVTTSGTAPQTITVRDSFGTPVIGGRITWVTPTGSFQSAVDYGLTVVGDVTFPVAPAGRANVTLTGVVLPGGAIANLQSQVLFGQGRTPSVRLPAEPSRSNHVVRVTLPDGSPVMGATVEANSLDQVAVVDGTTFTTPAVVTSGITNEFGEVYLVGYSNDSTSLDIEFNDGVLIQRLSGTLGRTDAEFQFEEMPWVDPLIDTTTVSVGALVTIPVAAAKPFSTVTATAPAGVAQKCAGRVLSARTNAAGKATLKVCAAASGKFKVSSAGAVSTGAVTIYAKGTKSLAVRQAKAVSRSHKTATVTWSAPAFTGGNPITNYTVKITSPTGAVATKTATSGTVTFTGLAGAKTYTVTVIPNTRLGAGAKTVLTVPVS